MRCLHRGRLGAQYIIKEGLIQGKKKAARAKKNICIVDHIVLGHSTIQESEKEGAVREKTARWCVAELSSWGKVSRHGRSWHFRLTSEVLQA